MKTSVITPMGLSPPIATELIDYLVKGEKKFISDATLLVADDREIEKSAELVVSALEARYNIHVHWVDLPFSDVTSEERNIEFMARCAEVIKGERVDHGCDYLYLNVAGGRKSMSILLTMLGQLTEIDGIYYVICPDVEIYNEKLERLRGKMEEHYTAPDLSEYYMEHREEFDKLMFPPRNTYHVIRVPYIPFPKDQLGKIVSLIKKRGAAKKMEVDVGRLELKGLERAGLIRMDRKKIYPTEQGNAIGDALG